MSYEQIVPDTLVLTRDPPDSGFCPRSWDIAYIEIDEDHLELCEINAAIAALKPPKGIEVVGLDDPAIMHDTIKQAVGE